MDDCLPHAGRRGQLPRAERRAQLLEIATVKFGERGYHATSMAEIALASGVTKPVLYQHFASKEDLYVAVIDEIGTGLEAGIADLVHEHATTPERIRAGIGIFFDLLTTQSSTLRLFFGAEFVSEKVQAEVSDVVDRAARSVGDVLVHTRQLSDADALLIGHACTAAVQAAAKQAHEATPHERDHILESLTTLLTHGLESFAASPPREP